MPTAPYPCDLHTHTARSDGNDTPSALIDAAAEAGVRVLAITDHDITAPETVDTDGGAIPLRAYGLSRGVAVLPGIEFSCDTRVEDVHIVALGCDFAHPFFAMEYEASVRSKIDGYKALCRLLAEDGMPLDWERDILLGGARPETAVQRKQLFEAMAEKGYADGWSRAKVLVQTTPRYQVRREKPDPIGIIRNIHRAGGLAILAHPYLIDDPAEWRGEPVPRAEYIDLLIGAGLDGIEAAYPYHKTSYKGSLSPDEIERRVRRDYGGRLPVISGGSDYHNDGKKGKDSGRNPSMAPDSSNQRRHQGAQNPRRLGEKGVTLAYFLDNPRLAALLDNEQMKRLEALP